MPEKGPRAPPISRGFFVRFSLGSLGIAVAVAAAAAVVVAITDAVGAAAAYLARGCSVCTIEMPRLDGRNVIGLGPAKAGLHSKHEEIALDPSALFGASLPGSVITDRQSIASITWKA